MTILHNFAELSCQGVIHKLRVLLAFPRLADFGLVISDDGIGPTTANELDTEGVKHRQVALT